MTKPPKGSVALGVLAGERHRLFSAPETGTLLDLLWEKRAELQFHAVFLVSFVSCRI